MPGGDAVRAQAASAFTDAFILTSIVSVGIVLAAAVAVWLFSRPSRHETVDEIAEERKFELDFAMVPAGVDDRSE